MTKRIGGHPLDNVPYSVEELSEHVRRGMRPRYFFFWGHTSRGTAVGKECLSQWYPASFEVHSQRYKTAEHYMMCEKARLFGDEATAKQILESEHPGAAKRLGRTIRNFVERVWEENRFDIVVRGNCAKFSQNAELRTFLVNTSRRILVEASPNDAIWGIGLMKESPAAQSPDEWKGLNLLGFALMKARSVFL